jgi:hypothetical protein
MMNVEVWNWPDCKLQYGGGDRTTVAETQTKQEYTPDGDIRKRQANTWSTLLRV